MGPNNAYLYFGPNKARGFLVYGNGKEVPMAHHIRQKKDGSTYVGVHTRHLSSPPGPVPVFLSPILLPVVHVEFGGKEGTISLVVRVGRLTRVLDHAILRHSMGKN